MPINCTVMHRRVAVRMAERLGDVGKGFRFFRREFLQHAALDRRNERAFVEQHDVERRRIARGLDLADLVDAEQRRESDVARRLPS